MLRRVLGHETHGSLHYLPEESMTTEKHDCKGKTCADCRCMARFESIHVCVNPLENSIPDAHEQTLPMHPACDNFIPKDALETA